MKITILGAGNIGTFIAAYLSLNKDSEIFLYTRNKDKISNIIEVDDKENNTSYFSNHINISNNISESIQNAKYIFITYPSDMLFNAFIQIKDYLTEDTKVVVVPGTGGVEFFAHLLMEKNCTLVGLQRVPAICRLKEYGKSVCVTGWKKELYISSLPSKNQNKIINDLHILFNIKVLSVGAYYNITFTPSNPILHTARLYTLFKKYPNKIAYTKNPKFYEDWDNESSDVLILCDGELQVIYKKLSNNDNKVISLLEHYESTDASSLTAKIRSINAFKDIYSPMVAINDSGYIPDLKSRYFLEDFPYGLCIIKGFAIIFNIKTPMIDKLILWMQNIYNKQYIDHEGNIGKDYIETGMPQRFSILSINNLNNVYV